MDRSGVWVQRDGGVFSSPLGHPGRSSDNRARPARRRLRWQRGLDPGVVPFGRVCPLSHSRIRQNVRVLTGNQATPAMVGRDRKRPRDGARRKKCLPSRPVRGRITAVATGGGRPCGRRPQTNDADEPSDAIERRLRPAMWHVDLSPPIDPKRYAPRERTMTIAACRSAWARQHRVYSGKGRVQ